MRYPVFPFAALVGQEDLRLGLLLNAINPAIGGILIRGEKGTAKSTAVRGLASLLPEMEVVAGCRFSCDPAQPRFFCSACRQGGTEKQSVRKKVRLITVPLNATEDRVAGGIDFSRAIQTGEVVLQPGLLAEANRSLLYVDEVNLLDDHIVDLILGAAASGRNVVEREGISCTHPARIILIGTMNPEEGDLRPQLLDRFGLCVAVAASLELDERIELLLRREAYDRDPERFIQRFQKESEVLRRRIVTARRLLPGIRFPPHMRRFISELCCAKAVAGHRADIVLEQAARALAAYAGDAMVRSEHIRRVAAMVLLHRMRDAEPPPPPPPSREESEPHDRENEVAPEQEQEQQAQQEQEEAQPSSDLDSSDQQRAEPQLQEEERDRQEQETPGAGDAARDMVFEIGEPFRVRTITAPKDRRTRRGSGRRSRSRISQKQGRYIKSVPAGAGVDNDIALDATIRAAAPFQRGRAERTGPAGSGLAVHLTPADVRVKIREKRIGNLLLFVVDGSGSMGARGRMTASKSAILSLLLDAYQKRDKVAMVTFRRQEAQVNLPVTGSVELAGRLLAEMPVGGRTPLSAGLVKGYELVRNYLIREPSGRPIVIILTDGKSNVSLGSDKPVDEMVHLATGMAQESRVQYIVVDTEEEGLVTFGLAKKLAAALGGEYCKTKDLQAEELVRLVREQQ